MATTGDAAAIATKGLVIRRAQARWYDALASVLTLGRDRQLRERLAELARLEPGDEVLDIGCGTGTLAVAAKRVVGTAGRVTGVDASPEMIELATRKASREGADVVFRTGAAERLPFDDTTLFRSRGGLLATVEPEGRTSRSDAPARRRLGRGDGGAAARRGISR